MSFVIVFDVFVGKIVGAIFIDGIIGKMHIQIGFIDFVGMLVLTCGQPRQSLIKDEHLEWDKTLHKHIDPEIEFIIINEAWRADIFLNNGILFMEIVDIFGEIDPSALGTRCRLNNIPILLFVLAI